MSEAYARGVDVASLLARSSSSSWTFSCQPHSLMHDSRRVTDRGIDMTINTNSDDNANN
jgi:hypothetical protein